MRVLDLFSGIGGFSLGLERTGGFETVAFCEIDPFCRKVLAKHWPSIPCHEDITKLRGEDVGPVDVVCGGYPCQPFSHAGKRGGASDDRHLWPEMHRLVDELRPAWVVGENVAGHISMGLDDVLSDLEALGYTARPFVIPACAVDAPHRRDRVWVVAYAGRERGKAARGQRQAIAGEGAGRGNNGGRGEPYAARQVSNGGAGENTGALPPAEGTDGRRRAQSCVGGVVDGLSSGAYGDRLNDEERMGRQKGRTESRVSKREDLRELRRDTPPSTASPGLHEAERCRHSVSGVPRQGRSGSGISAREGAETLQGVWPNIHADTLKEAQYVQSRVPLRNWQAECAEAMAWPPEPNIGRVATGVRSRVDRLRALGNAVVPQIPEMIGRAILEAEAAA